MIKNLKLSSLKKSNEMQPGINSFTDAINSAEDPRTLGFSILSEELQQGHWENCNKLITELEKKYPGDPKLLEFKHDFEQRYFMIKNIQNSQDAQQRTSLISNLKKGGIILAVLIILGLIFWIGYSSINAYSQYNQKINNQGQIEVLSTQVENLLLSGQPEKASEIVTMMKQIDPSDPKVIELSQKTDAFLKINTLYVAAQNEIAQGQNEQALANLQKIEAAYANYRDVPQLIEEISNKINISKAYDAGVTAFTQSDWQTAIDNFELINTLNPAFLSDNDEEMLLNSYLHRIIQLLESNTTSFEDIDNAENYYRRAIAMIPQSQTYLTQRENLQKISGDLLIMKYTQTALVIINDPNQTLGLVSQALNYVKKAANMDPNNASIQEEVKKLTLYQAGFSYYSGMNWASAIDQFSSLYKLDSSYAKGYARQLLYEAYVARGNVYYASGFYLDARKQFEAAESLSWENDNKMDLFMVELDLARTIGQIGDFKNAASYYKYAVESINYATRAVQSPSFVTDLTSAITMYNDGQYEDSYNLFTTILEQKKALFTETEVQVKKGMNVGILAAVNNSSIQAITERNDLAQQTTITEDQTLIIPSMQ